MDIPVLSPCLPGYIDVAQSILIILTMTGLFLDRYTLFSRLDPSSELMTTLTTDKPHEACRITERGKSPGGPLGGGNV